MLSVCTVSVDVFRKFTARHAVPETINQVIDVCASVREGNATLYGAMCNGSLVSVCAHDGSRVCYYLSNGNLSAGVASDFLTRVEQLQKEVISHE